MTFQTEQYEHVLSELKTLIPLHWDEIALNKEKIRLAPDYERYLTLAKNGVLHIITARDDAILVGYHISFVMPHLHYSYDLTCFTDIFFLRKEY